MYFQTSVVFNLAVALRYRELTVMFRTQFFLYLSKEMMIKTVP